MTTTAARFTNADVLDAINAGHTTIDMLAAHLGVSADSYNLRADLRQLADEQAIVVASVDPDGLKHFTAAH